MKRQALILGSIYLIVTLAGFYLCLPYFEIGTMLKDVAIYSLVWIVLSYSLYFVFVVLSKMGLLSKMMIKMRGLINFLPYLVLIIFLLECFIGVVMVFLFKDFLYVYSFIGAITVLHATKLTKELIDNY